MGLRNIREMGDPLLRKKSRPVKKINPRIQSILDDMVETLYSASGIGLAAPQVGILRRMIVVDLGDGTLYKMINPEITEQAEDEQTLDIEGCLSIPEYNGTVYRPKWIKVRYTDEKGQDHELEAQNLLARCICHEIDHLDGVLFIDKVDKAIDFNHLTQDMVDYMKEKGLINQQDDSEEDLKAEAEESEKPEPTAEEPVESGKPEPTAEEPAKSGQPEPIAEEHEPAVEQ